MSTTTTINAFQIPTLTDVPDIEQAVQPAINAIDSRVIPRFTTTGARDSAITAPVFGQFAAVSGTGEVYLYDGTTWISAVPRTKRKTADEAVTSSTTFQPDNHLLLSVEANAFYDGVMCLYQTAGTVGDLKVQFTGPSGFAYRLAVTGHDVSTAGLTGAFIIDTVNTTSVATGGIGIGNMIHAFYVFSVSTSTTAGTLTLEWAQNASDANSTTVSAHSFLKLWKVA